MQLVARVLWEDLVWVRVPAPRLNNLRVSYSGYYTTFPKLRRGFDSLHPLRDHHTPLFPHENILHYVAAVAQLVERVLGKDEVMGSNPISSSSRASSPERGWRSRRFADSYRFRFLLLRSY